MVLIEKNKYYTVMEDTRISDSNNYLSMIGRVDNCLQGRHVSVEEYSEKSEEKSVVIGVVQKIFAISVLYPKRIKVVMEEVLPGGRKGSHFECFFWNLFAIKLNTLLLQEQDVIIFSDVIIKPAPKISPTFRRHNNATFVPKYQMIVGNSKPKPIVLFFNQPVHDNDIAPVRTNNVTLDVQIEQNQISQHQLQNNEKMLQSVNSMRQPVPNNSLPMNPPIAACAAASVVSSRFQYPPSQLTLTVPSTTGSLTYTPLDKLQALLTSYNIFAAIQQVHKPPARTWNDKCHCILILVDESCINSTNRKDLMFHIFTPDTNDLPIFQVGQVIRVHKLKTEFHKTRVDGRIFSKNDLVLFSDRAGEEPLYPRNRSVSLVSQIDMLRVKELLDWFDSVYLCQPPMQPTTEDDDIDEGIREVLDMASMLTWNSIPSQGHIPIDTDQWAELYKLGVRKISQIEDVGRVNLFCKLICIYKNLDNASMVALDVEDGTWPLHNFKLYHPRKRPSTLMECDSVQLLRNVQILANYCSLFHHVIQDSDFLYLHNVEVRRDGQQLCLRMGKDRVVRISKAHTAALIIKRTIEITDTLIDDASSQPDSQLANIPGIFDSQLLSVPSGSQGVFVTGIFGPQFLNVARSNSQLDNIRTTLNSQLDNVSRACGSKVKNVGGTMGNQVVNVAGTSGCQSVPVKNSPVSNFSLVGQDESLLRTPVAKAMIKKRNQPPSFSSNRTLTLESSPENILLERSLPLSLGPSPESSPRTSPPGSRLRSPSPESYLPNSWFYPPACCNHDESDTAHPDVPSQNIPCCPDLNTAFATSTTTDRRDKLDIEDIAASSCPVNSNLRTTITEPGRDKFNIGEQKTTKSSRWPCIVRAYIKNFYHQPEDSLQKCIRGICPSCNSVFKMLPKMAFSLDTSGRRKLICAYCTEVSYLKVELCLRMQLYDGNAQNVYIAGKQAEMMLRTGCINCFHGNSDDRTAIIQTGIEEVWTRLVFDEDREENPMFDFVLQKDDNDQLRVIDMTRKSSAK